MLWFFWGFFVDGGDIFFDFKIFPKQIQVILNNDRKAIHRRKI